MEKGMQLLVYFMHYSRQQLHPACLPGYMCVGGRGVG